MSVPLRTEYCETIHPATGVVLDRIVIGMENRAKKPELCAIEDFIIEVGKRGDGRGSDSGVLYPRAVPVS